MITSDDPTALWYEHKSEYYQLVLELSLKILSDLGPLKCTQLKDEIKSLKCGYAVRKRFLDDLLQNETALFIQRSYRRYALTSGGRRKAEGLFAQDPQDRYYIYVIENKVNGRVYVGQTKDPVRRRIKHFTDLRHDKHVTLKLQNAFNEYGEETFEFRIVEENIRHYRRFSREIFWINNYNAIEMGYNRALPNTKKTHW